MKAVLLICEGPHDVAFALRSLGTNVTTCEFWGAKPPSKLPPPFGAGLGSARGLIAERLSERPFDDVGLSASARTMVAHFTTALYCTQRDVAILLLTTGGNCDANKVTALLRDLDAAMTLAVTMDDGSDPAHPLITSYSVAFLHDADQPGGDAEPMMAEFRRAYRSHFGDLSGVQPGRWIDTDTVRVGFFVYPSHPTLEGHLGPMVRAAWPAQMQAATTFIDDHKPPSGWAADKRWKAIITAAGQFEQPGSPMSMMLGRNRLNADVFRGVQLCRDLATFVLGG